MDNLQKTPDQQVKPIVEAVGEGIVKIEKNRQDLIQKTKDYAGEVGDFLVKGLDKLSKTQALQKWTKLANERYPDFDMELTRAYDFFEYVRENPFLLEEPEAESLITKVIKDNQHLALACINDIPQISSLGWVRKLAQDIIVKEAKKDPELVLGTINLYKDQPYAESYIRLAANIKPDCVFEFAGDFLDQPFAGDVLEDAAMKDPGSALLYVDEYEGASFGRVIALKAARKFKENVDQMKVEDFDKLMKEEDWFRSEYETMQELLNPVSYVTPVPVTPVPVTPSNEP
ncbi:MAG: hypothetical protein AAB373_00980 [Patescibacteria group bacterium]